MTLLEIKNLRISASGAEIIQGISFSIDRGEGISLIGPNGAGKTTVLRAIMRLIAISGGDMQLAGKPAGSYTARELAREIGYVPQRVPIAFPYTVEEFVRMSRYAYEPSLWRGSKDNESAVEEALEATDTAEFRKRPLPDLSGGELQRVLVAGAVAQKPKLLLLDEPAASLDPKYGKALHELLARLRSDFSLAVLSVSHDLNAALRHSSRILALRRGKLFFDGLPADLLKESRLEELYEIQFDRVAVSGDPGLGILPRI
jgi:iron complex transport system ATP-binding protein